MRSNYRRNLMTLASMSQNPLGYMGVDFNQNPPTFLGSRAPNSGDVANPGSQWVDQSVTPPVLYETPGQGIWTQTSGAINTINGTANQITASTTNGVTTLSTPATFVAPGSITAASGAITATNGNIVRGTAGNKDVYTSVASTTTAGANSAGTVTLVGGTATIATTAVTASSIIRLYRQGIGSTGAAALGLLSRGTISAGVSFIINSVQAADATALQASDVSVIGWEIVN